VRLVALVVVPLDPRALDGLHAVDRVGERAEERQAAQLAVGDDLHARALLQRDRVVDGAVLDRLERGARDRALREPLARLQQLRRPQHAAQDLGPDHVDHPLSPVSDEPRAHRTGRRRPDTLPRWRTTPPCRSVATASCWRPRWR
jgi:hypothetical protein